jgi:ribonuclease T1
VLTARSAPLVVGLVAGLLIGFLAGVAVRPVADGQTAAQGPSAATATGGPNGTAAAIPTGFRSVSLTSLPREAASTVAAIDAGGPFAYRQDGATFENRERLLPDRPAGYYREFTVPTPGVSGRGPRRIVAGANGEMYWTSDHYDSFAWIVR